ncbi:MAG: aminoacyl-tRNA hydrolase [Thermodesulfobacteriota bacterium]
MVVGLGNPGREYEATRHNIGFMAVDYLASRHGLVFKESKWQAELVKARVWGEDLLLVKPQTYMNRSGLAARAIAGFYRLENSHIIVIHDELDLPLGRVKVMTNRGAGGHNGIRSLIEHLGGKDFVRLRVGIGRPPAGWETANFVLSRFAAEEDGAVVEGLTRIEEAVRLIVEEGVAAAANRVNAA